MCGGLSDLFVQPYEGTKKEGIVGFAKGLGKGGVGAVTKTGAGSTILSKKENRFSTDNLIAIVGLVAYPGQGVCKSLHDVTHSRTRKQIVAARCAEGQYILENQRKQMIENSEILYAFNVMTSES
jgi:hypothetical protein